MNIIDAGFVDTHRHLHPNEEQAFTWWSNRLNKRKENKGWRLDYFFVTAGLTAYIRNAEILSQEKGSDHCPVLLELERKGLRYEKIALADTTKLWESIDWEDAKQRLLSTQRELTIAAKHRNQERMEKWQQRILHSVCAKLLAVRHVCSTAAGAGIDGVRWCTPHEKMTAALTLETKEYRAMADTVFYPYRPIKTNYNPYLDTAYWEERTKERQIQSVMGVYRSIWNRQNHSFACVETENAPVSLSELTDLLLRLDNPNAIADRGYFELYEFFRTCDKRSVTLTFQELEHLLGRKLGSQALRSEFWYRTGFGTISECWLKNGYRIGALHLEKRQRVSFRLVKEQEHRSYVVLPDVLKYERIPLEAKYELEHYFQYVIEKYGL